MNLNNPKALLIALAVVIGVIFITILVILPRSPRPAAGPSSSPQATLTYTGTDAMIEQGLTQNQVEDVKLAFHTFFTTKKQSPSSVDFTNVNHEHNSDTGLDKMLFDVAVDKKPAYQARIEYTDLDTIQLFVITNGQEIFNSGPVKINSSGS